MKTITRCGTLTLLLCTMLLAASPAQAQGRDRREHERERFHTPHWVFDDRFHHNHYYPAPGYAIVAVPPGSLALSFRGGGRFFFHSGVWYQPVNGSYVVVRPPAGIVVPVLPPAATTVWVAGAPYYYANDVYYAATPEGYMTAQPPMDAQPPLPQAPPAPQPQAAPTPAPGIWYYCDASQAYYPYVGECKSGWRTVPAAPPPGR